MNSNLVDQIVEAVLYEGQVLYPYRRLGKPARQQGFTVGCVYPETYSRHHNGTQPCLMQAECLVEVGDEPASFQASACFLHPMIREVGLMESVESARAGKVSILRVVSELKVGDELIQPCHEAVERRVDVPPIRLDCTRLVEQEIRFQFPQTRTLQPIVRDEMVVGLIRRRQESIKGKIEISAKPLGSGLLRVAVRVLNHTWVPPIDPNEPEPVLLQTLASTHIILHVHGGKFVSRVAPPPRHQHAIGLCRNIGAWPILVGDERSGERDTILVSPVMLSDYPRIAPEDPVEAFVQNTKIIPVCCPPACSRRQKLQLRYLPPSGSVSPSGRGCRIRGYSRGRHFNRL